jgi:hypothetical protein
MCGDGWISYSASPSATASAVEAALRQRSGAWALRPSAFVMRQDNYDTTTAYDAVIEG